MTTPTPITTFEDILAAMEQNHQLRAAMRAHILSQELLALPTRFVELQEQVNRLQQTIDGLVWDVTEVTHNVSALAKTTGSLTETTGSLTRRVDTLTEKMGTLTETVSALAEANPSLTERVDALTERVDALTNRVDNLTNRVDTLTERVDTISGSVSRLAGEDYESQVCNYAARFLRRELDINATVWATQRNKEALTSLLDSAEIEGKLSPEEVDDLDQADLILMSSTTDSHIVAEISITIQQSDIEGALRRANLLAKASGKDTIAIVAGTAESEMLDYHNTQVLIIAEHPIQSP